MAHDGGTHMTLSAPPASSLAMKHMFDLGATAAESLFICFLYVCLIPTDRFFAFTGTEVSCESCILLEMLIFP